MARASGKDFSLQYFFFLCPPSLGNIRQRLIFQKINWMDIDVLTIWRVLFISSKMRMIAVNDNECGGCCDAGVEAVSLSALSPP